MLEMGANGNITNENGDYELTEEGLSLEASQQGQKTPPWNIPVQKAVLWKSPTGMEAGRITGYFEDTTPTPDDCRIGLSAGDGDGVIYLYSDTFSSQLNIQENESRTVSGSGEQPLTVGAPVVGVSGSSAPRIARIDLSGISPSIDGSYTIVIINRGSGSIWFRDSSSASLAGANVRTSGGVDRELQGGGRLPITHYNGNYHVGQDRT